MAEYIPGKELPRHVTYADDALARRFWRATFRAGRRYPDARDAWDMPVLIQHERENDADYRLRKRTTPVRDYTGAIIRRYNDFVFRREPQVQAEGAWTDALADVDGKGTNMLSFLRKRLKAAQVDGIAVILAQSINVSAQPMTVAQAQRAGARQVLVPMSADALIDWDRTDGVLSRAVLLMQDEGGTYAMEYDANGNRRRIDVRKLANWWSVVGVGPWESTGYGMIPVVDMWPSFDDLDIDGSDGHGESQASPISEAQRAIYNITSLLSAEMYDNTFTQHVLFGADSSQFDAGNTQQPDKRGASVEWATKRLLCIPESAGKLEKAGSDVAQADSLRATIASYEDALYAAAGVARNSEQAESGVALAFRNNDLSATLSTLAACVEDTFARCIRLLSVGLRGTEPTLAMSDDYSPGDYGVELASVISAMMTPALPGTFKRQIASRFAQRHFPDLTPEQLIELEGEIDALSTPFTQQPFGGAE